LKKNKDLLKPIFGNVKHLSSMFKTSLLPNENLRSHYHQAFGILLGYGNKNAMAFRKREEMFDFLKSAPLNLRMLNDMDVHCIQLDRISAVDEKMAKTRNFTHSEVCEAVETLNDLRSSFKFTPSTLRGTALSPIELPGFLAIIEDEETQQIKHSYDRVRAQIIEILYSENFLERVLMQLTS